MLSFFLRAKSQEELNSAIVEQKSYQLYNEKKWNDLIDYGNMAVRKGYDYFYMQMRIGIAYYEKENYFLAEPHFKKALRFNAGDELAMEYLYYCYFFTGRYDEARLLSRGFSADLVQKIGLKKSSGIDFILAEGGTKITDSLTYYDVAKKKSVNYYNPATYFQLGLGHYVKNRVSLFHALTYFGQQNFIGSLRQLQYYVKAAIPTKNDWLISPSFHLINLNFVSESVPAKPSGTTTPFPPPITQTNVTNDNYYVGSIVIQKSIRKFVLSIGNTFSNMSNKNQFLHSGFVAYSVFGNSKLVLGCTGYLHTIDTYSTINTSLVPFIYVQPSSRVSFKLSYLANNGNNIVEDNGYLVNNSPDLTSERISVLGNFHINKHLTLYALYQLEFKQESVQLFNYRYNVLLGGVKISL